MEKKKILLVGESWVTSANHTKGWDTFSIVVPDAPCPWKRLQGYHVSRGDPAETRETLNERITYGGLDGKGLNQAIAAVRAEMDVRLIAAVGLIRDTLRAERIAIDTLIDLPGGCTLSRHSLNSPMKKYLYTCHRALGGDDGRRRG